MNRLVQFRLITLVIMVLICSLVLHWNVRKNSRFKFVQISSNYLIEKWKIQIGWPFTIADWIETKEFEVTFQTADVFTISDVQEYDRFVQDAGGRRVLIDSSSTGTIFRIAEIFYNVLFLILILGLSQFVVYLASKPFSLVAAPRITPPPK